MQRCTSSRRRRPRVRPPPPLPPPRRRRKHHLPKRLRGGRPVLHSLGQRLAAAGSGLADTFLRDNRVIPPVLALLALLVFAWIVAGIFVGGPEKDQALNGANLAQSESSAGAQEPL